MTWAAEIFDPGLNSDTAPEAVNAPAPTTAPTLVRSPLMVATPPTALIVPPPASTPPSTVEPACSASVSPACAKYTARPPEPSMVPKLDTVSRRSVSIDADISGDKRRRIAGGTVGQSRAGAEAAHEDAGIQVSRCTQTCDRTVIRRRPGFAQAVHGKQAQPYSTAAYQRGPIRGCAVGYGSPGRQLNAAAAAAHRAEISYGPADARVFVGKVVSKSPQLTPADSL